MIEARSMAESLAENVCDGNQDRFREVFKYYKRRQPPPDTSDVIDFNKTDSNEIQSVSLTTPETCRIDGLKPVSQWSAFTHNEVPGLYFIVNPFIDGYQRYWVRRCLRDYPCPPNICNIDAHMKRENDGNLWEESLHNRRDKNVNFDKTVVHKLRWTTLGFHHDWDTKVYSMEKRTSFPDDLSKLSQYVCDALGFSKFTAEAAIVNYYNLSSTLAPHTDHSEYDMSAPLLSFSFGQTGIFLIGGPTKETKPIAMFIQSGDIVVMSGPTRLAYHAVAKILPPRMPLTCFNLPEVSDREAKETKQPRLQDELHISGGDNGLSSLEDASDEKSKDVTLIEAPSESEVAADSSIGMVSQSCKMPGSLKHKLPSTELAEHECPPVAHFKENELSTNDWPDFENYLQTRRINMNVRQVLHEGQLVQPVNTEDCTAS